MENKKIIMLRHSPMNLKFNNSFYTNQLTKDIDPNDVIFIDVTSRNKDFDFIKEISPFYIGPITNNEGLTAKCFENFWQFGKVFKGKTLFNRNISKKKVVQYEFIASDKNGNPTEEWFKLREFGYNSDLAYRHPFIGETAYFYYINNGSVERLNYIDSRKKIYIPEYAKLVYNSKSYKKLKELVDEGKTIALIDFDAYNYYNEDYMKLRYERDLKKYGSLKYTLGDYLSIKTTKDAIDFPGLLAGHGFVLKLLLQGDIKVENGEIIDQNSILN